MIRSYRKKPVVIQAVQLTNDNMLNVYRWCGAKEWDSDPAQLKIKTLEGVMTASEGDYIVRGVHGEFYPVKPETFAATYDDAASPAQPSGEPVAWWIGPHDDIVAAATVNRYLADGRRSHGAAVRPLVFGDVPPVRGGEGAITDADGAPVLVYMVLDQHNTPVAHSQDKDDADFAAFHLANDEQQLRVVACYLTAASEPVSNAYTLPDTVQAIVDAAAAYEKKHGHYQDYRLSLRDDAFPVDKTERAIVVAYRKHAASEVRG